MTKNVNSGRVVEVVLAVNSCRLTEPRSLESSHCHYRLVCIASKPPRADDFEQIFFLLLLSFVSLEIYIRRYFVETIYDESVAREGECDDKFTVRIAS